MNDVFHSLAGILTAYQVRLSGNILDSSESLIQPSYSHLHCMPWKLEARNACIKRLA